MRSLLSLFALVVVGFWGTLLVGDTVEVCSSPALYLPVNEATSDTVTIDVDDSFEIGELNVRVNITSSWTGTYEIFAHSPAETGVLLHTEGGGATSDFNCTYSDLGRPNGFFDPDRVGDRASSPYDCKGCYWQPMGSVLDKDASFMSDFDGEDTEGTWELEIVHYVYGFGDFLSEWCVVAYSLPPVDELVCDTTDTGIYSATFACGADYDALRVYVNGELDQEVDDGYVAGEEVTIENTEALTTPQIAELQIVGVVEDEEGAPNFCTLVLPAEPAAEVTDEPDFRVSGGEPYLGILEFEEDVTIADIMVAVDATFSFLTTADVTVASNSGTSVQLHNNQGRDQSDLDLTYWQLGVGNGTEPYDCGCFMRPSGPGSLTDFAGETTQDDDGSGAWVAAASVIEGVGTVNAVTISVFDEAMALPVEELTCARADTPGVTIVRWVNGSAYDGLQVFVNGELVLDDDGTDLELGAGAANRFATAAQDAPSQTEVCVRGVVDDILGPTESCSRLVVVPPVEGVSCLSTGGEGRVRLSWENGGAYSAINIFVDGELEDTLGGDSETYTFDADEVPGSVLFGVQGEVDSLGVSATASCRALILESTDIEACASPRLRTGGDARRIRHAIEVEEGLNIEEVEIMLDLRATFAAAYDIGVTSPFGTEVQLHNNNEGELGGFLLVYDDDGEENEPPYDCACALQPSGPGELADFEGERSEGEWRLTVSTFDNGNLNSWCVRIDGCELEPPADLTCESEEDTVTLEWQNKDEYDEIVIFQDDTEIAVIEGDQESYELTTDPGRYDFVVRGVVGPPVDCSSAARCGGLVGFTEYCDETKSDTGLEADFTITVFDPIQVADVEVVVEMTAVWAPNIIELTSPLGTVVTLKDSAAFNLEEDNFSIDVIYSDSGTDTPPPFDCGCLVLPEEPAQLGDFREELADGEWTLNITNLTFDKATLNRWCVAIREGCSTIPVTIDSCVDNSGNIEITWTNNDDYDSIRILRNGVTIDEVDGDATSYTDLAVPPGLHSYRLKVSSGLDCVSGSAACEVEHGFAEECNEEDVEIPDDDAASSIIEVFSEGVLEDVRCQVDITHPFAATLEVFLYSPGGVEVQLQDTGKRKQDVIQVTYSDEGAPNNDDTNFACECLVQPSGPGTMADFRDDSPGGEWELEVVDTEPEEVGTLNAWCLQVFVGCDIEGPGDVTCEPTGGAIEVSWTNNDEYDAILIARDGVVLTELEGAEDSYVDYENDLSTGVYIYDVIALIEDLNCSELTSCETAIGRFAVTDEPDDGEIEDNSALHIFALDWDRASAGLDDDKDETEIVELEVQIDLTTTWVGQFDATVVSPANTSVQLLDDEDGFGQVEDLNVIFSDHGGVITEGGDSTCGCRVRPQGPGEMSDFVGETAEGEWLLVMNTEIEQGGGTLTSWEVAVFVDEIVGPAFKRGDVDGNGTTAPLIDAIALLEWGFQDGDEPPCMDAADIDDDGEVSALLDATSILEWAFIDGDAPPTPGPDDCGADLTPDDLDCLDHPCRG